MGEGYFSKRREIKRQIVKMNTPWIDRFKDWLFIWLMVIAAIVVLVLLVRGHANGAW
jgi:hypothetical protein